MVVKTVQSSTPRALNCVNYIVRMREYLTPPHAHMRRARRGSRLVYYRTKPRYKPSYILRLIFAITTSLSLSSFSRQPGDRFRGRGRASASASLHP